MTSDDFIITPILAGIGSAVSAAGGASGIAAGVGAAASVAGAGASIASSMKKAPDIKPISGPDPKLAEAEKAQQRQRATQRQGYRSTILSDALKEYSPQGKIRLGE